MLTEIVYRSDGVCWMPRRRLSPRSQSLLTAATPLAVLAAIAASLQIEYEMNRNVWESQSLLLMNSSIFTGEVSAPLERVVLHSSTEWYQLTVHTTGVN